MRRLYIWISAAVFCAAPIDNVAAQSDPRYIQFEPEHVKGALYTPDDESAPNVGILTLHRTQDYMGYDGCRELSRRGYLVLCMTPRSTNNEAKVNWEQNALDVREGVEFLRAQPGITSVLFWGWGNGGEITAFYQAVAENGVSYCQGSNKLVECGEELENLPPADGVVFIETVRGNAASSLRRLNGAVLNDAEIVLENAPVRIDPNLDPFNPSNGYNANGSSNYSEEFQRRYREAQARRMTELIAIAQAKLEAMETQGDPHPDDDVFVIRGAEMAGLMNLDISIHRSTLRPQKLLTNDGSVETRIVDSLRRPQPWRAAQSETFARGTLFLTVRSFLSAFATRANDSLTDVDYCSSNNSTPCAVQAISVPVLFTAMQAGSFLQFNEMHYEMAASEDKDYIIVEGATHTAEPCRPCEQSPGQFSNTKDNFFDYAAKWIDERY